jgi:hypothetical protein
MGVMGKLKRTTRAMQAAGCAVVTVGIPADHWDRLVTVKGGTDDSAADAVCKAVQRWVELQIDPEILELERKWLDN